MIRRGGYQLQNLNLKMSEAGISSFWDSKSLCLSMWVSMLIVAKS